MSHVRKRVVASGISCLRSGRTLSSRKDKKTDKFDKAIQLIDCNCNLLVLQGRIFRRMTGFSIEQLMHISVKGAETCDAMDIDDTVQLETHRPPFSRLSPNGGTINPFSLLDPTFTRSVFDTGTSFLRDTHVVSHPRGIREIPIEFKDRNDQSAHPDGHAPVIEDVTGVVQAQGTGTHEVVTVDDDAEDFPTGPVPHDPNYQPNAPDIEDLTDYNNDIEDEMIKAAIEASKRDAILLDNDNVTGSSIQHGLSHVEDVELARAVSLSLKAAEREKKMHKLEAEHQNLLKVSSSSNR